MSSVFITKHAFCPLQLKNNVMGHQHVHNSWKVPSRFHLLLKSSVSAVFISIWPIINTCCCVCFSRKSWWSCGNHGSLPLYGHQGKLFALEQQGLTKIFFSILRMLISQELFGYWNYQCLLKSYLFLSGEFHACLFLFSEEEAKLGARRLARCLQKIGFKV